MNKYLPTDTTSVSAITAGVCQPTGNTHQTYFEKTKSIGERVSEWFITPLRAIESEGFIVLMVLFPLYEKHLRVSEHLPAGKPFSKGHPVFKIIGRDLGLSSADAYLFWTNMRNGILHQALPKQEDGFDYVLHCGSNAVEKRDQVFWIDAFALRDHLLEKIEDNLRMWKVDDVKLPLVFSPLSQPHNAK
jgi:hypothetical protein